MIGQQDHDSIQAEYDGHEGLNEISQRAQWSAAGFPVIKMVPKQTNKKSTRSSEAGAEVSLDALMKCKQMVYFHIWCTPTALNCICKKDWKGTLVD